VNVINFIYRSLGFWDRGYPNCSEWQYINRPAIWRCNKFLNSENITGLNKAKVKARPSFDSHACRKWNKKHLPTSLTPWIADSELQVERLFQKHLTARCYQQHRDSSSSFKSRATWLESSTDIDETNNALGKHFDILAREEESHWERGSSTRPHSPFASLIQLISVWQVFKSQPISARLANSFGGPFIRERFAKRKRLNGFTTVFVDTRLWKTKQPRKRFQNFRQSYVLSTYQIESPPAWRREGQKVTLVAVIGGFRSDRSITRKTDESFGNVSAGVLFSRVAYQRKRW